MEAWTGHSTEILTLFAVVVLFAAVVRGFTGFGFSALTVSALYLVLPVAAIVPVVYALEVAASVQMLRSVWQHANFKIFTFLVAGSLVGTPLGQQLLLALPAQRSKQLASVLVILLVIMIAAGFRFKRQTGYPYYIAVGLIGGCINGAVAMGGLVISALLMATTLPVATLRATLVLVLFYLGLYSLASGFINGLVGPEDMVTAILMLPPMIIGIIFGARMFHPDKTRLYRRATLVLLAILAASGLLIN